MRGTKKRVDVNSLRRPELCVRTVRARNNRYNTKQEDQGLPRGKTTRHEPSNFDPSAYIPAAAIMFVCPTAKPVVKIPRTCMMSIRRAEEDDGCVSVEAQQGCVREFQ